MSLDEAIGTRLSGAPDAPRPGAAPSHRSRTTAPVLRLAVSWTLALALLVIGLPAAVGISWRVVLPVLGSLRWPAVLALLGVWLVGKYVHSFLLTAAAPGLSRPRAVTVNLTGSAVASVMPLGGAAGLEVNRRMMRSWDVDGRGFAGFAFLVNLWGVGCKLLLPALAVVGLAVEREKVGTPLQAAAYSTGVTFVALLVATTLLLASPAGAQEVGTVLDRAAGLCCRLAGRPYEPHLASALSGVRRDCGRLVALGWWRMSLGVAGYAAAQCLLLGLCLHLAGAGNTVPEVVAGFAVERTLTILPLTPGGLGVGDLGLVGVLLALGGHPAGVAAAAVLYRTFTFAVEIPVGACLLGMWLLHRRSTPWPGGPQQHAAISPPSGPASDGRARDEVPDLQRRLAADASEQGGCGRRLGAGPHGVEGGAVSPQRLDAPAVVGAPQELGPQQPLREAAVQKVMEAADQAFVPVLAHGGGDDGQHG